MAPRAVQPNAENCTRAELRAAAKAAASHVSYERIMAILALLEGIARDQMLRLYTISARTLRTWVRRFNEFGIDGLIERKSPGAPRKISAQECQQYRQLLEQPDLADLAEQTHWTARKFHGDLRDIHQVEVGYSTVVRFPHEQGDCLKVPTAFADYQHDHVRLVSLKP